MTNNNYPLTLLFDGACPLCQLEMDKLMARNTQGLLAFVDISPSDFDVAPYARVHAAAREDMLARIHAMLPDGSLVVGTRVFRLAYGAVGLGAWAAPTGWPVLEWVFEMAYAIFARHRYGISRFFMPLVQRIAAARAVNSSRACHGGGCTVNPEDRSTS